MRKRERERDSGGRMKRQQESNCFLVFPLNSPVPFDFAYLIQLVEFNG